MTLDEEKEQLKSAAVGMAALRVWCGGFLILIAVLKLPVMGGEWEFPARLSKWLEVAASGGALPQMSAFLKAIAKQASAVAAVSGIVEAMLGVLLVLGLFTRFACFVSVALAVFYWSITARMGVATVGATLTMAVTAAVLFIGNAGLHYGIDGMLARKKTSTVREA